MLNPFARRAGHLRRYREIAQVLIHYGFDNVLEQLGLKRLLSLPNRLVGHVRPVEPLSAATRLRMAIEEFGPTFIQLGQALSTRPDLLPPEFLSELVRLRDDVSPFPFETARAIIETELGKPLHELFPIFDEEPLAAASLGQVHAAELPDGDPVVVKVLRPDIHAQVEIDLDILRDMANLAEERTSVGRRYALTDLAEEFSVTLRAELDYVREANNVERFQRNFANRPEVVIPAVYTDYSTQRVLTLERIHGIKIDDVEALRAAGLDPETIANQAIDLSLQEVFVDGFFHADPHPGNLYVMEGNVIGVMDFGMVGFLDRHTKEQLLRLFVAIFTRDADQVVTELIQMEMVVGNVDHRRMSRDISRFMERFWGLPLKDLTFKEIFEGLMPVAFRHRLTLPSNLWLLAKALVMMEGTGRVLDPELNVFELTKPYATRALRELQSPAAWAKRAGRGIQDWSELWSSAPQRLPRLLNQLTKGELTLSHNVKNVDNTLARLDRMVNRLVVGIIIAATIIAISLILPLLTPGQAQIGALVLIGLGLLSVLLAGAWMLWSLWRSSRR